MSSNMLDYQFRREASLSTIGMNFEYILGTVGRHLEYRTEVS